MRSWLRGVRDTLGAQLWPLPTGAVIVALLVGFGLPRLDAAVDEDLSAGTANMLFSGDASAARSLLETISSSLITVTSLTFSLTVITLQLASSQFSPRLLRTFNSDRFVQGTLALFLATFVYALTVLRSIRSAAEGGQGEFVPRMAVTLAFVLALLSVLALVFFLSHLTQRIRVETMLRDVRHEAMRTMRQVLPDHGDSTEQVDPVATRPPSAGTLLVSEEGFLSAVDQGQLTGLAESEGVVLVIDHAPGTFVVQGTPLGSVWSVDGASIPDDRLEELSNRVGACLSLSFERTATQDTGFGLRQLTDVANKALSTGINDPTTAVHALRHISALLCDLAGRTLGDVELRDDDGRVRVVLHRPGFEDYLHAALTEPRVYGRSDPVATVHLFQVLLDLAHRVAPEQRGAVRDQLDLLRSSSVGQDFDAAVRARLSTFDGEVRRALGDA